MKCGREMSRWKPGLLLAPCDGRRADGEHDDERSCVARPGPIEDGSPVAPTLNINIPIQIRACPKRLAAVKRKSGAMSAASISDAPLSGEAEMQGQIERENFSDGKAA